MKILAAALSVVGLVAVSSLGAVNITLKAKIGSTTYTGFIPASVFSPGVPIEIQVWAQDPTGVLGVAGDIVASGGCSYGTPTRGATWAVTSLSGGLYGIGDGSGTPGAPIGSYTGYDAGSCFAGTLPAANVIQGDYITTPDACTGYSVPTTATVAHQGPVTQAVDANGNYTVTGWNVGGIPGANGAMGGLGSGQAPSASFNANYGASFPGVMVCSYTCTWNSASGATTLSWVDSGKAGASTHGGWFTAGVAQGDDSVGNIWGLTFLPEPITLSFFAVAGLLVTRRRMA